MKPEPWTRADDATLRALWGVKTAGQIAERLNRSRNAVIGRANRIGLPALPVMAHGAKRWSSADIATLIALRLKGLPWSEIGSALGRPPASCATRFSNLRLRGR